MKADLKRKDDRIEQQTKELAQAGETQKAAIEKQKRELSTTNKKLQTQLENANRQVEEQT